MFADKVQEKTTNVGTGSYAVGGVSNLIPGWSTFREKFPTSGRRVALWAINDDESRWEKVICTITLGPPDLLARDEVLASSDGGTLIDWGATETVYLYSAPFSEIDEGATNGNLAEDVDDLPMLVRGLWRKSATPAAGYARIEEKVSESISTPVGIINETSGDVTLYGVAPNHIQRTLVRASATTFSVTFDCMDSTNTVRMRRSTTLTKSTAGAWAAGHNENGMGNGLTIANSTWYHAFAIIKDGVADAYLDTSISAANKPAGTSYFRRLGSVKTDGSAQIVDFVQDGDRVRWAASVVDVNNTNYGSGSSTNVAISVPPGVAVDAEFRILGIAGATFSMDVCTPGQVSNGELLAAYASGFNGQAAGYARIRTNTSAQVTIEISVVVGGINVSLATYGWIDDCGRNG